MPNIHLQQRLLKTQSSSPPNTMASDDDEYSDEDFDETQDASQIPGDLDTYGSSGSRTLQLSQAPSSMSRSSSQQTTGSLETPPPRPTLSSKAGAKPPKPPKAVPTRGRGSHGRGRGDSRGGGSRRGAVTA